jgi:hypothetical protein
MRYLSAALVVEGNSDEWFLPVVLQRALQEICTRLAEGYVEIPGVQVLWPVVGSGGGLVQGICEVAERALDDIAVLFYHYDGTARPDRAAERYWKPLKAAWSNIDGGRELVAVVPVREMEAWALADPDALRTVFGSNCVRGEPFFRAAGTADVESLVDPKRTLREIAARGRRVRRPVPDPADYLTRLAELLSMERLSAVPSFRQWSTDTTEVLRRMGYLP